MERSPGKTIAARRPALVCGIVLILGSVSSSVVRAQGLESPQVVGGEAVESGQFPFLVYVRTNGSYCTGSLIRSDWVLTAAHCGEPIAVDITDTRQGVYPNHVVASIPVRQWIPHSGFDDVDLANDIALVQLAGDATRSPPTVNGAPLYTPEPIALAASPASTASSFGKLMVAGFGQTETEYAPNFANWAANVPSIAAGQCDFLIDPKLELCFGTYPNTCQGDSGSAVFRKESGRFVQYGIFSYNGGPERCGEINSVATYVPGFLDWIDAQIQSAGNPSTTGGITLGWELPPPSSNGVATGVSNAQGYAFSTAGTIKSVELLVDGKKEATVPCCSERGDVPGVYPNAPVLSGFSAAVNWGRFADGIHQMTLVVRDTRGNETRETRAVRTVKVAEGVSFARGLSVDGASCLFTGSNTFQCTGLDFQGGRCMGTVTFRWSDGKQAFEVVDGCD